MKKIIHKIIATLLLFTLVAPNLSILGAYGITYALSNEELAEQTSNTQSINVEFNSYFEGGKHSVTANLQDTVKLFLNIKVKQAGYLKNAEISFQNANFKIAEEIKNNAIQSIDTQNNKIVLKQLNSDLNLSLEIPVVFLNNNYVTEDYFAKESKVIFNGTYVNKDAKEKQVSKEIVNKLSWNAEAESIVNTEITKYIPYALGEKYGVIIQTKINTGIKDSQLPIKNTKITLSAPIINQQKPTYVTVVANNTKATNGQENGTDFTNQNYNYNSENGITTIQVSNSANEIAWIKNVTDEYLVTFVFEGEQIYNYVKENGVNAQVELKTEIEVYNSQETILENNKTITINPSQETGTILDLKLIAQSKIDKGQIYANYEAQNKKEVEYVVTYIATVNTSSLIDKIELTQTEDKFLAADSEDFSINNYAYIKELKISEKVFGKILGENGSLTVFNANQEKIGTIDSKTSKDGNGNYILNIGTENANELSIVTSKPVTEGSLIINVKKALKTQIGYTKSELGSFEKIVTQVQEKDGNAITKEIQLQEPSTVANIEVSKTDLSTVVKNENVEIRATLDTSSTQNALYKNPTLTITLPSYITEVNLKSYDIVNENGLAIKGTPQVQTKNGNKVIEIALEGNQTQYTTNSQHKGTIVVLNADLTADTLTPSNNNKITMSYTNQNEVATNKNGTVEAKVNFVAPTGVVTATNISGYAKDGEDIMSIATEETVEVAINAYEEKRTATISGKVINNYENKIDNIVILGRIPSKDTKQIDGAQSLGANFDTKLSGKVTVTGIESEKYTIYYSSNPAATKDLTDTNNAWTTTASENVKSYLIVTNNFEMQKGTVIDFEYNIEIPANVTYNSDTYETYKVYYNNVSSIGTLPESKNASLLKITTGKGPELSAKITSTADVVREGQVVKMKVTVKNTGSTTLKNIKVNIPRPEDTIFIEYISGTGFLAQEEMTTQTININQIDAMQSAEVIYYLEMQQNEEENSTFPKEILNTANITVDGIKGQIPAEDYKFNLLEGKIRLTMIGDIKEGEVLQTKGSLEYDIFISNISELETLTNTVVTIPLPKGIKYESAVIKDDPLSEIEVTEGITYNEENNTITFNLGELETSKIIELKLAVEKYEGDLSIFAYAKADEVEEHYSNITEYKAEVIKLEVSELTSTPKYVKEGEEITYSFTIKNKGNTTIDIINIEDILPSELYFVRATYTYYDQKKAVSQLTDDKLIFSLQLGAGETTEIKIIAKAKLLPDQNDKEIKNKITISTQGLENSILTNTITNTIEYNNQLHEDIDNQNGNTSETPTINKYKITGTAWLDANKNGNREASEQLLPNIEVMLLNKENNTIVRDAYTNDEKIVTTDENGKYEFSNLQSGEYLAIFLYDAAKYNITTFHEANANEDTNSDVIKSILILDGKNRIVGASDVIKITNNNARNIDIGLYVEEKFDLKLDKYITKITRTTPTSGSATYNYDNSKLTKVEILSRNLGKSSIVVEYKIVVTNEGAIPGYAKKIVDYLPEDVGFNTEINEDWYLSNNGSLYNTSLENELIAPGESKELTLVLTKTITEESLGVLNNTAEIYETYNEQGLEDMDSSENNRVEKEDDMSRADIVLGLVTGKIVIYTTTALGVLFLLGIGVFEIKRRVLNKR